jgi:hypothetical protein
MTYEIGGLEWRRDVASLRDDQCSSPLVVPSRGYNYSYGSCLIPRLREGEWEKRGGVWRPKEILDFNYDNAFKLESVAQSFYLESLIEVLKVYARSHESTAECQTYYLRICCSFLVPQQRVSLPNPC